MILARNTWYTVITPGNNLGRLFVVLNGGTGATLYGATTTNPTTAEKHPIREVLAADPMTEAEAIMLYPYIRWEGDALADVSVVVMGAEKEYELSAA